MTTVTPSIDIATNYPSLGGTVPLLIPNTSVPRAVSVAPLFGLMCSSLYKGTISLIKKYFAVLHFLSNLYITALAILKSQYKGKKGKIEVKKAL